MTSCNFNNIVTLEDNEHKFVRNLNRCRLRFISSANSVGTVSGRQTGIGLELLVILLIYYHFNNVLKMKGQSGIYSNRPTPIVRPNIGRVCLR